MGASIEIVNGEEFQRRAVRLMEKLSAYPHLTLEKLQDGIRSVMYMLQGYIAEYPPAPAESGYRRTGTLGRLWTAAVPYVEHVSDTEIEGRLGNATPYGPYVQDPVQQAWMHRGRWQTTQDVVDQHLDEINAILAEVGLRIVEELAEVE